MAVKNFWNEDTSTKAVNLYNNGNTVDEIAVALGEGKVEVTRRQVIGKLTSLGVYKKPEPTPRVKQVKPALPEKKQIFDAFSKAGLELSSLSRANVDDLMRLAEHLDITLPEPAKK